MQLLKSVAEATGLREGPEGVASLLATVHRLEYTRVSELAREIRVPIPVVAAMRRELEARGLLERRRGVCLTPAGVRFVEEELGLSSRHDPLCRECGGRRVVVAPALAPVLERLEAAFEKRPRVDTRFDQASCTPGTSLRRALYMHRAGALEGRRVLILGDDDYVSIAIGLLGRALGAARFVDRLAVVESDPRILDHVRRVAAAEGFELEALEVDLRDGLPDPLRAAFDGFETDPPYTQSGLELFVSRGVEALRPGAGRHGFLSFGHRAPEEMHRIQSFLARSGLVVRELVPDFNEYVGATLLCGSSQMFRLESTATSRPLLPRGFFGEPIYTNELAPVERVYRCTRCGERFEVGAGRPFETIEALKSAGCRCGHDRFRRMRRPAVVRAGRARTAVRPARKEDLAAVVRFEAEIARISFPEDPVTDFDRIHRRLAGAFGDERQSMRVIDQGGEPAGWLWMSLSENFVTGQRYVRLRSLAVDPALRGTPAAESLLRYAVEWAEASGAEWVTANVHHTNLAMRALYAKLGFKVKHLTVELPLERRREPGPDRGGSGV